jgi:hypothetical protein
MSPETMTTIVDLTEVSRRKARQRYAVIAAQELPRRGERYLPLYAALTIAVLAIIAAIGWVLPSPAGAQTPAPCGQTSAIAQELSSRYGEHPVASGMRASGGVIRIYATADGRTWTLLAETAPGMACVIAAGRNWKTMPPGEPA